MTNDPTLAELDRLIVRNHSEVRDDIRELTARVNEIAALKVDSAMYNVQTVQFQKDLEQRDKRVDSIVERFRDAQAVLAAAIDRLKAEQAEKASRRFTAFIGPTAAGIVIAVATIIIGRVLKL